MYQQNNVIIQEYNKIKDTIYKNFPTTAFFFIVSEKNKKGMLHFHAIVAIKNFIDYNYTIKNNLIKILTTVSSIVYDVKVESLYGFKDIKN